MARRNFKGTILQRLEERYIPEPNSGCWIWIGALSNTGYGQINYRRHTRFAHRISYMLHKGKIPLGFQLDHKCRMRCCINPDHLEPVTPSINVLRGDGPKRTKEARAEVTHCKHGHEFSAENTRITPEGWRQCRACRQTARTKSNVKRAIEKATNRV